MQICVYKIFPSLQDSIPCSVNKVSWDWSIPGAIWKTCCNYIYISFPLNDIKKEFLFVSPSHSTHFEQWISFYYFQLKRIAPNYFSYNFYNKQKTKVKNKAMKRDWDCLFWLFFQSFHYKFEPRVKCISYASADLLLLTFDLSCVSYFSCIIVKRVKNAWSISNVSF